MRPAPVAALALLLTLLSAPPALAAGGSEPLHALFEEFFEESLELNPVFATFVGDHRYNDRFANSISPEVRRRSEAMHRKYLKRLQAIDSSGLKGQDLLSYEIFKRARENALEGFAHPGHLVPINQFFSTPNFVAQMGSGKGVQPFKTVKDYENWLSRVKGFAAWADQAVTNMKEGVRKGVVQPRVLMERTLPQLAAQITDDPEKSLFYGPVTSMPGEFSEEDRKRLTAAYTKSITEVIVPAYRRLHDYIEKEYIPRTRDSVGLGEVPGGEAWYAYLVRNTTTTEMTPEQIHRIGLGEVARIHQEMEKVMEEVGFKGDRKAFFKFVNDDPRFIAGSKEELLGEYTDLRERVHAAARNLFSVYPKSDYEIRAVEPFREKSSSAASYQAAAPDGSRDGIFYVNTYDLKARPKWGVESLFLHEAVPGHHFQISLQREIQDLPRFRRFGRVTAFSEGWGLYAESLGRELGVYTDPYQYFGALSAELWRAIRLVVDTGLHSRGWTRQQVLDYMYANAAVKEARAVSEAERYIAIPSQALAYKIGQLKISELRARAEKTLGDEFDVKGFHGQVLTDGALPLDVLEAKIDRWIGSHSP